MFQSSKISACLFTGQQLVSLPSFPSGISVLGSYLLFVFQRSWKGIFENKFPCVMHLSCFGGRNSLSNMGPTLSPQSWVFKLHFHFLLYSSCISDNQCYWAAKQRKTPRIWHICDRCLYNGMCGLVSARGFRCSLSQLFMQGNAPVISAFPVSITGKLKHWQPWCTWEKKKHQNNQNY